jgi:hypothetical protein
MAGQTCLTYRFVFDHNGLGLLFYIGAVLTALGHRAE